MQARPRTRREARPRRQLTRRVVGWRPWEPLSATRPWWLRLLLTVPGGAFSLAVAGVGVGLVLAVLVLLDGGQLPGPSAPGPSDTAGAPPASLAEEVVAGVLLFLVLPFGVLTLLQLSMLPPRGDSGCAARVVRSVRLLRPEARRAWRARYGHLPHLSGWDLWGIPYLFHSSPDVARERADRERERRTWGSTVLWAGEERRVIRVVDIAAWAAAGPLPGRLELRAPRSAVLPVLPAGLVLLVAGVGAVWLEPGWAAAAFLALGVLTTTAAVAMVLRPAVLVLDRDGMRGRSWLTRTDELWEACGDFRPYGVPGTYGVEYRSDGRSPSTAHTLVRTRRGRRALPSHYGMQGEELRRLLEAYRALGLGEQRR